MINDQNSKSLKRKIDPRKVSDQYSVFLVGIASNWNVEGLQLENQSLWPDFSYIALFWMISNFMIIIKINTKQYYDK